MSQTLTRHLPDFKNAAEFFELYDISIPTFESYRKNLRYFGQWLDEHSFAGDLPISPDIIKQYLLDLVNQGYTFNTVDQRRHTLTWLHRINHFSDEDNPAYHSSLRHISRQIKRIRASMNQTNKPTQKEPLTFSDLKKILRRCPDTLHGLRDRALLLIGFAAGLRSEEIVELNVQDLKPIRDSKTRTARVCILKSKGDQMAAGQSVIVDTPRTRYCPLSAVKTWIEAADIKDGKLFRRIRGKSAVQPQAIKPSSVRRIVKHYCEKSGLDPALYAGHSLRRGVLITCIKKGQALKDVKEHARHSQTNTTEHYVGDTVSRKNVTRGIFG